MRAMTIDLGIRFPSERERLWRQVEAERELTPTQRLLMVQDILAAVERLSSAGHQRARQLQFHRRCEEEWCRLMSRFISDHVPASNSLV
jgi:hypothetical protein